MSGIIYVLVVVSFNVPALVLVEKTRDTTENFSVDKTTEKCSFWSKLIKECPKVVRTTPSPEIPVNVPDDYSAKDLGFSFSAFVITLFASLAIALTGAFACWCCRTFCRQGSFSSSNSRIVSPPSSIYNNSGLALEPLVSLQRHNYRRSNSLPSYANVASSASAVSSSAPSVEDPPPTYASLFGGKESADKS